MVCLLRGKHRCIARVINRTTPPPQWFYGLFPGPLGWAGGRRELLDFMMQRKINRGRHTVRLGATPSGLISAHLHHPPFFYRPDALPAAQPTVSKHWRQKLIDSAACISFLPLIALEIRFWWCLTNSVPICLKQIRLIFAGGNTKSGGR